MLITSSLQEKFTSEQIFGNQKKMQVQVVRFNPDMFVSSGIAIENVYATIGNLRDQEQILRYLHDIVMFERVTVASIIGIRDKIPPRENFILNDFISHFDPNGKNDSLTVLKTQISENTMINVRALKQTVLSLDGRYIEPDYEDPKVHILTLDGRYLGHVYSWANSPRIDVQGIRTSVWNILAQVKGFGYKGIAPILIDSAVQLARILNYPRTAVVEPYPVMITILERYGFKPDYFRRSWMFNVINWAGIPIASYELVVLV